MKIYGNIESQFPVKVSGKVQELHLKNMYHWNQQIFTQIMGYITYSNIV
jgi:hypothetical protein